MGKRGRQQGFTNKIVRAAAAARRERDEEAHGIASEVYNTVIDGRPAFGSAPPWMMGPLLYVAEASAPAVVKAHKLPVEDGEDIAAYLMAGMADVLMSMVGAFDRKHFEQWRNDDGKPAPAGEPAPESEPEAAAAEDEAPQDAGA